MAWQMQGRVRNSESLFTFVWLKKVHFHFCKKLTMFHRGTEIILSDLSQEEDLSIFKNLQFITNLKIKNQIFDEILNTEGI